MSKRARKRRDRNKKGANHGNNPNTCGPPGVQLSHFAAPLGTAKWLS